MIGGKQPTILVSKLTQGRPKFWGRTLEWTTQSWLMENSQHYWSQSQHKEDISSEEEHKSEQPSHDWWKTASTIGLKVNTRKTQVLRKNTRVNNPVMIDGKQPTILVSKSTPRRPKFRGRTLEWTTPVMIDGKQPTILVSKSTPRRPKLWGRTLEWTTQS